MGNSGSSSASPPPASAASPASPASPANAPDATAASPTSEHADPQQLSRTFAEDEASVAALVTLPVVAPNGLDVDGRVIPHTEELMLKVRHCERSDMDITLCFQCFGDPADGNPVILLVCGLNMQLYAWDEAFCEDLVRAGFFVIRYDNRDIGYSTKIEQRGSVIGARLLLPNAWASAFGEKLPYNMDDMAKDGLALLSALHIPRAHVFGISMGGMIAQCMALLAPDVVMSLTSVMSTTNAPDLPDTQLWVKLWMLRQPPKNCTVEQLLDFRVNSLRYLLRQALPVDVVYLKQRYLISLNRSSYGQGLIRQAAVVRRCPGRDEALQRLTIPALVIHGAQDLVVPPVHGYRTAQMLPHARMLVLKNMGHYYHPAFFHTIVTAFADMASTTVGPGRPLCPRTPSKDAAVSASDPAAAARPAMATMATMFRPLVATPQSHVGAAAVKVVNVAVPTAGDPALPEAVVLDLHCDTSAAAPGSSTDGAPGEAPLPQPYVVGSPSTWDSAIFPSPSYSGSSAPAGVAPGGEAGPIGRVVPVLSGTPLVDFIAAVREREMATATHTGAGAAATPVTELDGGRISRAPSGVPTPTYPSSRQRTFAHVTADEVCASEDARSSVADECELSGVEPGLERHGSLHAFAAPPLNGNDIASAEEVASTLLPPMLGADTEDLPVVDDTEATAAPDTTKPKRDES